MAALAIAWTLANPNVTTTILGATKASQLTENLKALDAQKLLTTEVMARIDAILGNKPFMDLA
jgi:aryl-alcohol dehydrogenase-like predicted oxidoreductase